MGYNCYWWGNHFWRLGLTGWWIQLIFWSLLVSGFFYLLFRFRNQSPADYQKNPEPLGILKKRYALGEIGEEEFKRIKKEISG